MSERPHHDMGTCWCGELHAREHVLARRVEQLETALREAVALIDKTTHNVPGWTGPDVWWKTEADDVTARARAALCGGTATPGYCTCPDGADGNPCLDCGLPEATSGGTATPEEKP